MQPNEGLSKGQGGPAGALVVVSPPVEGGVMDYAKILADAAAAEFLPFDSTASGQRDRLPGRHDCTFFIQVSHYGYQKRGMPLGLLQWARARKRGGARIGFYFHELFAFGPPWRSSFWLSPVQRLVSGEMAKLADFWITNQQSSARWLVRAGGDKPRLVLPVFSNMGESPRYVAARTNDLVVCGSAGLREHTYRSVGAELFDWARERGLQIHDIGPRLAPRTSEQLAREGVTVHGSLSKEGIGHLLPGAVYGLVAYPAAHVAKSGVFAAYCAHGVCPLVVSETCPEADGLVEGVHYARWPELRVSQHDAASIGGRAFEWYGSHTIQVHAAAVLRLSHAQYRTGEADPAPAERRVRA